MTTTAKAPTPGWVLWVTGLSGAGKTTLSHRLVDEFRRQQRPVLLLDGDVLREIFPAGAGLQVDERRALASAYARLCREISRQGIWVVCATVSMFHEVRDWNRQHLERYFEVFLDVPNAELQRRDPKGIYSRLAAGTERNVMGFDVAAEFPRAPHLRVPTHEHSVDASVALVLATFESHRAQLEGQGAPT